MTVKIENKKLGRINPFIYGGFMEFLENHISGMWAEMLVNRRLENCLPEKSVPEFWRVYGYNNTASYAIDSGPYNGKCCQMISCTQNKGGFSGIAQRGIGVTKGREYTGYVYLKQEGIREPVQIILGKDYGVFVQPYAICEINGVTGEWAKYTFTFTSDATDDDDAEFIIRCAGEGKLWIDHPSLMPADNLHGWRKEVVECVRQLKPNIIRFPGGCYADTYHWKNAIGQRDLRTPQGNFVWSNMPIDYMETGTRLSNHNRPTEPNDVGIDEFMQLCELTGTQALICVNLGTGTPEDAAHWIEYCNGAKDTFWGAKRAENGHPEPYHIMYWQVGNEMYIPSNVGYSGLDGYIAGYKRFYTAMKAADPSIKLVIDGGDKTEWNREILKQCGDICDYIDVHFYPGWTVKHDENPIEDVFESILNQTNYVETQLSQLRKDIDDAGLTGKVKIAVCEYNSSGSWGSIRALIAPQGSALFVAGLLNLFQKNADLIEICNYSNLTNAWWASCIRTQREKCHTTAAFHVLSMFSNLSGNVLLESSTSGDADVLDAAASYDEQNLIAVLSVVNKSQSTISIDIMLEGFTINGDSSITYSWAPSMECLNDFNSPERILPITESCGDISNISLRPCSLTFLRIPVSISKKD